MVAVLAGWIILGTEGRGPAPAWIEHVWLILTMVAVAWLVARLIVGAAMLVLRRQRDADSARTRALRTQLLIIRRMGVLAVGVVATVAVLWTFEGMRTLWAMQVVDATEFTVLVRATATANDAGSAWELRCDVREGMLEWLQREQPQALSRVHGGSAVSR